jgi:hypothetical protein
MDEMNIKTVLEGFTKELRVQRDFHKEMHAVQVKAVKAADELLKCMDKMNDIKEGAK